MTPSDLDISIRLAVFMGWEKIDPPPPSGVAGLPEKYWYPRASSVFFAVNNQHVPWQWQPLIRPDHAALVMAEAARRGWLVEISIDPRSAYTSARIEAPEFRNQAWRISAEERGVSPESWCRAVCRAVLYTLDAIEREAAVTPQERLERSV